MTNKQNRILSLGVVLVVAGGIWVACQAHGIMMLPGYAVLLVGAILIVYVGETTK
jgi:hypothetical protein